MRLLGLASLLDPHHPECQEFRWTRGSLVHLDCRQSRRLLEARPAQLTRGNLGPLVSLRIPGSLDSLQPPEAPEAPWRPGSIHLPRNKPLDSVYCF